MKAEDLHSKASCELLRREVGGKSQKMGVLGEAVADNPNYRVTRRGSDALLEKLFHIPRPSWPIKRGSNSGEGRLEAGMAIYVGLMHFVEDLFSKFIGRRKEQSMSKEQHPIAN